MNLPDKTIIFEAVLTILLTVAYVRGKDGCKVMNFLDCEKNKTFTGHVIKSFRILAPGLEMCQHYCYLEDQCVSYNLNAGVGMVTSCELNDADHWIIPGHMVPKIGSKYCPIKNPCSSNPCPPNRFCTPDFSWDTFTCEGCESPLGMEDGSILDSQITASSIAKNYPVHTPQGGRLNNFRNPTVHIGAWAGDSVVGEYMQVDLGGVKKVTKIATQGRPSYSQWVTQYSMSYSNDTNSWTNYQKDYTKKFPANADSSTIVTHELEVPIIARHIRVIVQQWYKQPSMRMELYGCTRY